MLLPAACNGLGEIRNSRAGLKAHFSNDLGVFLVLLACFSGAQVVLGPVSSDCVHDSRFGDVSSVSGPVHGGELCGVMQLTHLVAPRLQLPAAAAFQCNPFLVQLL